MTKIPSKPKTRVASDEPAPTKLGLLISLLSRPDGADLGTLMTATGWQAHSVRGAIAGAVRKKGYEVLSEKLDNKRIWRISRQESAE